MHGTLKEPLRVNLDEAPDVVWEILRLWTVQQGNPQVPLYEGGLLTGWPSYVVDGFAICRRESGLMQAYMTWKRAQDRSKKRKGR